MSSLIYTERRVNLGNLSAKLADFLDKLDETNVSSISVGDKHATIGLILDNISVSIKIKDNGEIE